MIIRNTIDQSLLGSLIIQLCLTLAFTVSICVQSSAQTDVSGTVSGTWTKANSPYYLQDDVTIPNGQTLTIEAGVEVEAKGWYGIFVDGRILCNGKKGAMIKMHSDFKDGWKGIRFIETDPSNDTSYINFVEISDGHNPRSSTRYYDGGGAIQVAEYGKVIINGCYVHHNKAKSGGGISIHGDFDNPSGAIITNCIVENNEAFDYSDHGIGHAGGISLVLANTVVKNCIVRNNTSKGTFGGVRVYGGESEIINSTIIGNSANEPLASSAFAGGLGCEQKAEVKICRSDILNNFSRGQGGGIWVNHNSFISAQECRIDSNYIEPLFGEVRGVAVYIRDGNNGSFKNCTFRNNGYNDKNDGVNSTVYVNSGEVSLANCKIENNYGSAFRILNSGEISASNCVFANNILGCALIQSEGNFVNCNFLNNYGRFFKGSAAMFAQSCDPSFYNCIFNGNRDTTGMVANIYIYNSSADPTFKNCIIEGGKDKFYGDGAGSNYSGTYENNLDINPQFINPTKGPGVNFDATKADWRLRNDCSQISPALNKGTSALPTGLLMPEVDLDGNPRIATDTVDIGAYEIQVPKDRAYIISNISDTTKLCLGQDTVLQISAVASNPSFSWYTSNDGSDWKFYDLGEKAVFKEVPIDLDNSMLRGQMRADCGLTDTITTRLKVVDVPKVSLRDTFYNCSGNGVVVSNLDDDDYLYYWEDNSSDHPKIFNPETSTSQVVRVVNSNGCTVTAQFDIANVLSPEVELGDDQNMSSNGKTVLTAPSGNYNYLWSTGDTTMEVTISGSEYPKGENQFWVELTDENGCSGRDTISLFIGTKSIRELADFNSIEIYPNPLTGGDLTLLNLSNYQSNYPVKILNFFGEALYSGLVSDLKGRLVSGVYQVEVRSRKGNVVVVKRLVVVE